MRDDKQPEQELNAGDVAEKSETRIVVLYSTTRRKKAGFDFVQISTVREGNWSPHHCLDDEPGVVEFLYGSKKGWKKVPEKEWTEWEKVAFGRVYKRSSREAKRLAGKFNGQDVTYLPTKGAEISDKVLDIWFAGGKLYVKFESHGVRVIAEGDTFSYTSAEGENDA